MSVSPLHWLAGFLPKDTKEVNYFAAQAVIGFDGGAGLAERGRNAPICVAARPLSAANRGDSMRISERVRRILRSPVDMTVIAIRQQVKSSDLTRRRAADKSIMASLANELGRS
jgi:hypothetical protein